LNNIGRHGEDRARTRAHAVDRRDDRLRALAHGFHRLAGHAGEVEQVDRIHFNQRADDLEHVAAGAEIAALTRDDKNLDLLVLRRRAKDVRDLGIAFEGQRVLLVRPVERKRRDLAVNLKADVPRLVICKRECDRIRHHDD
jgi:hypothetical protein